MLALWFNAVAEANDANPRARLHTPQAGFCTVRLGFLGAQTRFGFAHKFFLAVSPARFRANDFGGEMRAGVRPSGKAFGPRQRAGVVRTVAKNGLRHVPRQMRATANLPERAEETGSTGRFTSWVKASSERVRPKLASSSESGVILVKL